ncbi:MAG: cellulase family glycosylhydrolase [Oligosphaeraceae bacterium]
MISERWSEKKAWDWQRSRPWMRGCNFMGSDCVNRVDQWQELGFEGRYATADRELGLAQSIGFNSVRLILQFEVWLEQHDGFMERLERYIGLCASHGISVMLVIANDCCVPKDENWQPKHCGPQHVDWGYHGGVKNSPHTALKGMGYSLLDDPELAKKFWEMTAEVIQRYAHDPRVCVWNLFNEPGNCGRGEHTIPHLRRLFEIAREIGPDQPLTADIWSGRFDRVTPAEKVAVELSDVISYHCYGNFDESVWRIHELKRLNRPLLNTEWLHRIQHNTVQELFPLFFLERIDCYCWGFVAGLYQTYEPWEGMWLHVRDDGQMPADWDFTKWQHDLMRPSLRPYDPREVAVIRRYSALADEDFSRARQA